MRNSRLIPAGIAALLIVICLFWLPGLDGMRDNSLFILPIAIMLACAFCTYRKSLSISMLMIYAACHIYFVTTTYGAMSTVYQFATFSVIYSVLVLNRRWYDRRNIIYDAVCIIALVNVAAMIPQTFHVYLLPAVPAGVIYERAFGLTANPNEVSALLAICLPCFFRRRWVWCIPAVILGLALARTTNGMLAASVIGIIYLVMKYRERFIYKILLTSIPLAMLLFGLYVDRFDFADHMKGRGIVYFKTVQLASAHPTGWGLNQYRYIIPMLTYTPHMSDVQKMALWVQYSRKDLFDKAVVAVTGSEDEKVIEQRLQAGILPAAFVQVHCDPLEWTFIAGYAGLFLLLIALIGTLRGAFKTQDKIPALCFTASLCTALFFFSWQIISTTIITVFMAAMIHGRTDIDNAVWETKG